MISNIFCKKLKTSLNLYSKWNLYSTTQLAVGGTFYKQNSTTGLSQTLFTDNNNINNSPVKGIRNIISSANEISLNNLRDNPGANKKKVRVGRGIGSGRGKTSGRGHGGQKARAGHNIPRGFEGGQTPLYKKMRKYGFSNAMFSRNLIPISFLDLERLITDNKLNVNETITMKHLFDAKAVQAVKQGVKLLSNGSDNFNHKISIELTDFSQVAREKIESLGGSAKNVYYDRVGLRYLLKPYKFDFIPKRARVPLKLKDKYPDHPTGYMGAYSTVGGKQEEEEEEDTLAAANQQN